MSNTLYNIVHTTRRILHKDPVMAQYGFKDHIVRKYGDLLPTQKRVPDNPDIHLIVGTGDRQQQIPTYGFILMECSPVFNAMLSGPWVEAQEYATVNGQYPIKIRLPEDDGEAMRILCAILATEKYPSRGSCVLQEVTCRVRPKLETLEQVAILAEKYLLRWAVDLEYWQELTMQHTKWPLCPLYRGDHYVRRTAYLVRRFGSNPRVFQPCPPMDRYNLRPKKRKPYSG